MFTFSSTVCLLFYQLFVYFLLAVRSLFYQLFVYFSINCLFTFLSAVCLLLQSRVVDMRCGVCDEMTTCLFISYQLFVYFLSAFCLPFSSAVCLLLGSGHEMGCSWWNDQRTHDHRSLYDRIEKLSTIVHGSQFHLFWSPKIWLQVVFCLNGSFFDQFKA